jgi:hypothetical protein
MKSRVRYGTQTTASSVGAYSSASSGAGRRMVAADSQNDDDDMIEEYKLEDQHHLVNSLGPFYEASGGSANPSLVADRRSTASSAQQSTSSAAFRCFLSSASSTSSSNSGSGKPALRTVSIMETLSELTAGNGSAPSAAGRLSTSARSRAPVTGPAPLNQSDAIVHQTGATVQRRKKTLPPVQPHASVSALLTDAQWNAYGKLQGPPVQPHGSRSAIVDVSTASVVKRSSLGEQVHRDRVWDVSRLGSKLAQTGRKGRSVDDILATQMSAAAVAAAVKSRERERERESSHLASTTSAHGYGSLERRRRRRPGTRAAFAMSARRGETDWEREEDEEDESLVMISPPLLRSVVHPPAKKDHGLSKISSVSALTSMASPHGQRERREAAARHQQAYKPPTEWFKKKRTQQQPQQQVALHKTAHPPVQERGQTPDWIHKILHVARRGNLLKLVSPDPKHETPKNGQL